LQDNSKEPSYTMEMSKAKRSVLRSGWGLWKFAWALLGPVFGYLNFSPSISIATGATIDPHQIYSTIILITNTGRVPVYDLSFGCGIGSGSDPKAGFTVLNSNPSINKSDLRPMSRLSSGQVASKSCAVGEVSGNTGLTFIVHFTWPLIGYKDQRSAVFEVKEGPSGYFLLPSGAD
jgi:hypothetical protein